MNLRPKNKEELQKREAIGIIRASRFIRGYARSKKVINFDTICAIHKEIFKDAWPEIAGIFRVENIEITDSKHYPCHHSRVVEKVKIADALLVEKIEKLRLLAGMLLSHDDSKKKVFKAVRDIVTVAAWIQHKITYIHPFREGNGRTARLVANLILERFGLVGISIKIEKENKTIYRKSLAQIDQHKDYEPLISLIFEGLIDRYHDAEMKACNLTTRGHKKHKIAKITL